MALIFGVPGYFMRKRGFPIAAAFIVLAYLSIGRGIWTEFRERGLEVAEEHRDSIDQLI